MCTVLWIRRWRTEERRRAFGESSNSTAHRQVACASRRTNWYSALPCAAAAALHGCLPPSLAAQCQAANLDGTNLVIAVSSSAWAAKLRYQLTAVLGHLKTCDDLPPVDAMRIRIQPLRLEPATRPVSRAPLSAETAAVIRHVADNTTDPALRAALQRLVRHVVKPRP